MEAESAAFFTFSTNQLKVIISYSLFKQNNFRKPEQN